MSHKLLKDEITKFKEWAESQEGHFGEWETDYPHWDNLYKACDEFITTVDPNNGNTADMEMLLYGIARDNESETIIETLNLRQLILLSQFAHKFAEPDAKWQLAMALGKQSRCTEIENLLRKFVNDDDEYIRRRASMALADIHKCG